MSTSTLSAESFAEELEFAIKDYFVGKVSRCGATLTVVLPENVTYTLKVE